MLKEPKLTPVERRAYYVARRHCLANLAQHKIAERHGLTRSLVAKDIALARARGWLTVVRRGPGRGAGRRATIEYRLTPPSPLIALEEDLRERLVLKDALVVPTGKTPEETRRSVGSWAQWYLDLVLYRGRPCSIALGGGAAINAFLDAFRPDDLDDWRQVSFVQAASDAFSTVVRPQEIMQLESSAMRQLARILAEVHLDLPIEQYPAGIAMNRDRLGKGSKAAKVLAKACGADIVLLGIGHLVDPAGSITTLGDKLQRLGSSPEEFATRGVVGDLLYSFLLEEGHAVHEVEFPGRVVGPSLDDLRTLASTPSGKMVIAVAPGVVKARPAWIAARSRFINVIITDEDTARRMLDYSRPTVAEEGTPVPDGKSSVGHGG